LAWRVEELVTYDNQTWTTVCADQTLSGAPVPLLSASTYGEPDKVATSAVKGRVWFLPPDEAVTHLCKRMGDRRAAAAASLALYTEILG
jgi:hypothetical protein